MLLRVRPYMMGLGLSLAAQGLLGLSGCSGGKVAQRSTTSPPLANGQRSQTSNTAPPPAMVERDAQRAVAAVLTQYLTLSIARRHESAYALLSEKDHRARAWITYVNAEREADRLRDQVGSLGQPKFKITWLKVGAEMATGIVRLTTGIGTSKVRFVLLHDAAGWKLDYENSWQPVADAATD